MLQTHRGALVAAIDSGSTPSLHAAVVVSQVVV